MMVILFATSGTTKVGSPSLGCDVCAYAQKPMQSQTNSPVESHRAVDFIENKMQVAAFVSFEGRIRGDFGRAADSKLSSCILTGSDEKAPHSLSGRAPSSQPRRQR